MTPLVPRNALDKLRANMREHGLRETMERSGMWLTERLFNSMLHRHSRAPLAAFADAAASMHFSAEDLAETYLFLGGEKPALSKVKSEYEALSADLAIRYGDRELAYPQCYAVEQGSAFLLYALVRSLRPGIMLETGVANGHSSFFILSAMRANDHGLLHSVDCSGEVGALLGDEERERWTLHVLDKDNLKKSFSRALHELPPLDFFLHDSDHTNAWQAFELELALRRLAPHGVVASDDCDGCYAFLDVCRNAGLRPVILVEKRKVFGLIFTQPPRELLKHADSDRSLTRPALVRV